MQKIIAEAQKLFESISCLGAEGVEFYSQRAIIEAILREANKGYDLCERFPSWSQKKARLL